MPSLRVPESNNEVADLTLALEYYEAFIERWNVVSRGNPTTLVKPTSAVVVLGTSEVLAFWKQLQQLTAMLAPNFGQTRFSDSNPQTDESKPWYKRITHETPGGDPKYTWEGVFLRSSFFPGGPDGGKGWPGPGFRRKYPKEIYHLKDKGTPGEVARFVIYINRNTASSDSASTQNRTVANDRITGALNVSAGFNFRTSTPIEQRKYRMCFCRCTEVNTWVYDKTLKLKDVTVIEDFGFIQLGDYFGPWIIEDIAKGLREMQITLHYNTGVIPTAIVAHERRTISSTVASYIFIGYPDELDILTCGLDVINDGIAAFGQNLIAVAMANYGSNTDGITTNFYPLNGAIVIDGVAVCSTFQQGFPATASYEVTYDDNYPTISGGEQYAELGSTFGFTLYNSDIIYKVINLPDPLNTSGKFTLYKSVNHLDQFFNAQEDLFGSVSDTYGKLETYHSMSVQANETVGIRIGNAFANPGYTGNYGRGYGVILYGMTAWEFNWI